MSRSGTECPSIRSGGKEEARADSMDDLPAVSIDALDVSFSYLTFALVPLRHRAEAFR